MSVSRCLGVAVQTLSRVPRSEWKAYIDALPLACPTPDICTAKPGCRDYCADYFRVQFRAQVRLEQIKARTAGGRRGQG